MNKTIPPHNEPSASATPLSVLQSIPYFILPGLAFALMSWWGISALNKAGVSLLWSFTSLFITCLTSLGGLGILLAKAEKTNISLLKRLWLKPLRIPDVLIGLVIGFLGMFAYIGLQPVTAWLLEFWPYGLPSWQRSIFDNGMFFGVHLAGSFWLIAVFILVYLANVVGEELWWRGYILPRQAKGIGKNAWIANGLLWTLFHLFQPWDIISLIPIALGISFMTQYRKSAWVGIIAHGVLNSMTWIALTKQIMAG